MSTATPKLHSTRQEMLDAVDIRNAAGLLTIAEAAERYGVDPQRVADAVDAAELGSATFEYEEGALTLIPTSDGAVAEWLEEARAH